MVAPLSYMVPIMSERYIQPLRTAVQAAFFVYCIILVFKFLIFLSYIQSGDFSATRPDAIDLFHPEAGLFSLVAWMRGSRLSPAYPAAVVMFLSALSLALLLRRSFCSWICPVGALSEWLWKLGFHYTNRKIFLSSSIDAWLRRLKYLLLLLFLGYAFFRSLPELESFLGSSGQALSDTRLAGFFRHPSFPTALIIIMLLLLSLRLRNPFCRYLCPYGALLAIASVFSPVAVLRNRDRCVSCGVCSAVCPSGIDVANAVRVNNPECIGCWRCISYCRVHSALRMTLFNRIILPGILFIFFLFLLFWGGMQAGKLTGFWNSSINAADYRTDR